MRWHKIAEPQTANSTLELLHLTIMRIIMYVPTACI